MNPDAHIQQDVLAQIKWNSLLTLAAIDVTVEAGAVLLTGKVDTYTKKIQAVKEAKRVHGVQAVADEIQVELFPGHVKQDQDLTEIVENVLTWQTTLPEDKIKVNVENGVVLLEGEVEWEYQRQAAKNAVIHLKGVRDFQNNITLKPIIAPFDLKYRIKEALERSATTDDSNITVDVTGHKVILKGKVHSYPEKEATEKTAWAAPGITNVESNLSIEVTDGVPLI